MGQEVIFRPPSDYVLDYIINDSIPLVSVQHDAFRIYFRDTSYTADHLPQIRQELDAAYHRILNVLNISGYAYGIYLVAVDSREEMKDLMGYEIKGGAAQGHDLVFFVFNPEIRPQFKHEIFHLMSYEAWGPTKHRLLDEGGATYTDNVCFYDNPMYSINAWYLQEKVLFSLESLIYDFDQKAKENDVIAYIQSAGIFKYLYEKYGVDKMKALWRRGFESFDEVYGFSVAQLEADWLHFISTVPLPEGFDINRLREGCG